MSIVTFLIPSLGRPYLKTTIESLYAQTSDQWECIIMFDGVEPTISPTDKIRIIQNEKIGYPSNMRNLMIPMVDTKWIGFVDDDNTLKNTYVERLLTYISQGTYDLIHFTMFYTWNKELVPRPHINKLLYAQFGMSFAVRKAFIEEKNIKFRENQGNEDFEFLTDCENAKASLLITHDPQYIVPKISTWKF